MSVTLERFDPASATEADMRSLHRLYSILDDEDLPGDPPKPFDLQVSDWRMDFARFPVRRWVVRDGPEIVAAALTHFDIEENLSNGMGRVMVHPGHRGRGLARLLAEPVLEHLEENGRTRLDTWTTVGNPGEGLAAELGLAKVMHERRSRLRVAELDLGLMRKWIDRASERASGYRLLEMKSPFPDEHLEQFCEMMTVMNTAPLEDYEMDDEHLSPADWRDIESSLMQGQNVINNLTAVHSATGEFAGFTQIKTQGRQPDLAWQWDTGVHPAHRNKGLGRWLKAAMITRLIEEYPDVERVDTENAGSNVPMLSINIEMGFRPVHEINGWQGELAMAKKRLGF